MANTVSVLLAYSSREGQTRKIMKRIAERLQEHGLKSELLDVQQVRGVMDIMKYQCVVVAGSIHYGHYSSHFRRFLKRHIQQLKQCHSVFFSVNLTARRAERNTALSSPYVRRVLKTLDWQPSISDVFAGALRYRSYPWYDSMMIRLIMAMMKGPTDTSKDYDFTPWERVDALADRMVSEFSLTPESGME